jgi:hypothetical protein
MTWWMASGCVLLKASTFDGSKHDCRWKQHPVEPWNLRMSNASEQNMESELAYGTAKLTVQSCSAVNLAGS